eukprot:4010325-Amphidinium_carterae.1
MDANAQLSERSPRSDKHASRCGHAVWHVVLVLASKQPQLAWVVCVPLLVLTPESGPSPQDTPQLDAPQMECT